MGSLIVVTIEDRPVGRHAHHRSRPFVGDRLIDLTIARPGHGDLRVGSARVRGRLPDPQAIDTGGRWCVQVGAFNSHRRLRSSRSNSCTSTRTPT